MSGPQRRIIPSEELTEFQRWQFNSLLDKAVPEEQQAPEFIAAEPAEDVPGLEQAETQEPIEPEINLSAEPVSTQDIANAMPYPTAEEIEAIQQQAHEEGYQAGLAEGRVQSAAELQQLTGLLAALTDTMQQTETALADSVLELALLVAQQMIGDELRQHPKQLLAPIRDALSAIPTPTSPAKLFLSPDDLQLLEQDLQYELPADVWKLLPDQQMSSGSCRIETPNTQLEFSLASRWKKITGVLGAKSVPDFPVGQYGGDVLPAEFASLATLDVAASTSDTASIITPSARPDTDDANT
ncbi:FliH/SctL family protein [Chitinibacter sp. GC72]|uniref:FliH/SctL family protein n=1 Tax=Chitinibacter sp. GC72 TaxID=1526917 RepID=UPI0012FCFA8A|nr:FliH/SctL family protein [Chitinibacter sp. GC72]